MEPIIKVDNVSMCFNLSTEKHESLKEYLLAMVQGRLQYDEFYALRDVSLDIMPGDFYGLVGLNGSGKSTLLKTIAGVYKQAGGSGYLFRAATVQDFSAVTGACLLVKASVWDEVGGLDEKFAVAFNDVDFCLRVRDAGYRVAWTPYARLTHYESKSRGGDEKDPAKAARFASEQQRLYAIHGKEKILDDPYYNPSLTRDREDFSESDDLRKLKEGSLTVRWRE